MHCFITFQLTHVRINCWCRCWSSPPCFMTLSTELSDCNIDKIIFDKIGQLTLPFYFHLQKLKMFGQFLMYVYSFLSSKINFSQRQNKGQQPDSTKKMVWILQHIIKVNLANSNRILRIIRKGFNYCITCSVLYFRCCISWYDHHLWVSKIKMAAKVLQTLCNIGLSKIIYSHKNLKDWSCN